MRPRARALHVRNKQDKYPASTKETLRQAIPRPTRATVVVDLEDENK